MCSVLLILTLAGGGNATARVDNLPCPEGNFTAQHWVSDAAVVTSINVVTVRPGADG